jgi:hypothetical protein
MRPIFAAMNKDLSRIGKIVPSLPALVPFWPSDPCESELESEVEVVLVVESEAECDESLAVDESSRASCAIISARLDNNHDSTIITRMSWPFHIILHRKNEMLDNHL